MHIGPLLEPVIVDQCHHDHHHEADASQTSWRFR